MKIKKNVPLKKYTTFRIGGRAEYFVEAGTKKQIIEAVKWARNKKLPFFILGGGSNLLVSDKGYDGLVIKIQNSKFKIQNDNSKFKIICESGALLSSLVSEAIKNSLTGLEWAAGIPGTVGGAVRGNAGAFEGEMEDNIESVEVFDSEKMQIKKLSNRNCRFGYRKSIFKEKRNLVILSCEMAFKKRDKKTIKEKVQKYLAYRYQRHPKEPSAGSVFKNTGKEPAALLIHRSGLTGEKIGKAKISEKHSNFIVNSGGADAKDVIRLINLVKKTVKKKFKISLREEIQPLGKF